VAITVAADRKVGRKLRFGLREKADGGDGGVSLGGLDARLTVSVKVISEGADVAVAVSIGIGANRTIKARESRRGRIARISAKADDRLDGLHGEKDGFRKAL